MDFLNLCFLKKASLNIVKNLRNNNNKKNILDLSDVIGLNNNNIFNNNIKKQKIKM